MIVIEIGDALDICESLRQSDIDRLLARNVPILALARSWDGLHSPVLRARIVPTEPRRFEFAEWVRDEPGQPAFIVPVHSRFAEFDDLIAFDGAVIGSWLGRAALMGQEQLYGFRVAEHIDVHETPLEWLAAGRRGVVVSDEARAGELLRPVPMVAASVDHGRRLQKLCTPPAPRISVPAPQRRAAA